MQIRRTCTCTVLIYIEIIISQLMLNIRFPPCVEYVYMYVGICTGPRKEFWSCLCQAVTKKEKMFKLTDGGHLR